LEILSALMFVIQANRSGFLYVLDAKEGQAHCGRPR
jgi:hypothetical protein